MQHSQQRSPVATAQTAAAPRAPIRARGHRFAPVLAAGVVLIGGLWLAFRLFLVQPSNDGDWEYGMQVLPHITMAGDIVEVQHERDFRWTTDGPISSDYIDQSFDVQRLQRLWFVLEPFTLAPFYGFKGVAHTYFVFDFQDQAPVAISVESRRQRGQGYDPVHGLLNYYELMYVWGTEQDLTGQRAVREKNQLYMFPVSGPVDSGRRLFRELAQTSQQLETQPRFYNSLTSNCTNELAKAANQAEPGAIPFNVGMILPGYSDDVLYDLGFIPNDAPLETVRQRYAITETVVASLHRQDFSQLLRQQLGVV
jgi:hypothetical protein